MIKRTRSMASVAFSVSNSNVNYNSHTAPFRNSIIAVHETTQKEWGS